MEFNLDEILSYASSEYEGEFLHGEFGPGLKYYLERLDRLMLTGGRALDAGCGAGQWSIALAQRFSIVDSIDLKPERLEVLKKVVDSMGIKNIEMQTGSIENLPYADGSFDAVFCYGVIMFTDIEKTLKEFHRVSRPGGRIYVCLNADGWSKYLIEARGKDDKDIREIGYSTLYNTYWHRSLKKGLAQEQQVIRRIYSLLPFKRFKLINSCLERLIGPAIHKRSLKKRVVGNELWYNVNKYCGSKWAEYLIEDVFEIARPNSGKPRHCGITRAYHPKEFEELMSSAGFDNFQWAHEGGLVCNWLSPAVKPKYEGYYKSELSVWECIFDKPAPVTPSLLLHYENAILARKTSICLSTVEENFISNKSTTYPPHLLKHNRWMRDKLGGESYLKALAALLTEKADNEEEAAKSLIRFVQRAIFRDPVSQPTIEGGALPDSLTILMCARGRCGHTSNLLLELAIHVGFEARLRQFPAHVIAEIKVGGRWVVADADAFKNGVIPINKNGLLISMDDLMKNPYQLDRFQPTGWFIRSGSRFIRRLIGDRVYRYYGYVDALDPDVRGFVSGYYLPEAVGSPPSIPSITRFEKDGDNMVLEWTPSTTRNCRLLGYRVSVGTVSRGWSYDFPGDGDEILRSTSSDVLRLETIDTRMAFPLPTGVSKLYASVTAFSDRIEKEPDTFFWPSEEASCGF